MGHLKTKVLCCTSGGSWRQRSMTFYFTPYLGIRGQKWFLTHSWFILYPILINLVSNKRELIFLSLDNQVFGINGPFDFYFGWKYAFLVIFLQIWRNIPRQNVFSLKMEKFQKFKLSQKLTKYTCYISWKVWDFSSFGLKIRLIYINFDENWNFLPYLVKNFIFQV